MSHLVLLLGESPLPTVPGWLLRFSTSTSTVSTGVATAPSVCVRRLLVGASSSSGRRGAPAFSFRSQSISAAGDLSQNGYLSLSLSLSLTNELPHSLSVFLPHELRQAFTSHSLTSSVIPSRLSLSLSLSLTLSLTRSLPTQARTQAQKRHAANFPNKHNLMTFLRLATLAGLSVSCLEQPVKFAGGLLQPRKKHLQLQAWLSNPTSHEFRWLSRAKRQLPRRGKEQQHGFCKKAPGSF